jgi:uncharacterized protein YwqG
MAGLRAGQKDGVEKLARPAIALRQGSSSFSRIGGLPDLAESYEWPLDEDGKPLAFLCQIALTDLPDVARELELPEAGTLYFFFDQEQSVWGFDPKDFPKWRVIYAPAEMVGNAERLAPDGLADNYIYNAVPLAFSTIATYPGEYDKRLTASGIDDQAYWNFLDTQRGDPPFHMIGGHPYAVQNANMEDDCQLVSGGIYLGDGSGCHSASGKALLGQPHDWRLLLQLDSDDDAGMMWGDVGMLYFWIRASDLAKKDFSKVWMVLQCG